MPPSWKLPVNLQTGVEGRIASNINLSFIQQLLTESSPTLMTEWVITDIRIPVAVILELFGAEAFTFTFGVNLLLGSDIVWSDSENIDVQEGKVAHTYQTILAGNLNQPIVVPRGRSLAVECFGKLAVVEPTHESKINLALAGQVSPNPPPLFQQEQGMISYYTQKLSGHRTL